MELSQQFPAGSAVAMFCDMLRTTAGDNFCINDILVLIQCFVIALASDLRQASLPFLQIVLKPFVLL